MNKDYVMRDEIIFGSYDKEKYLGGIRRTTVPYSVMRTLFKLGFVDANESQNNSPTTQEFLELASRVCGKRNDDETSIEFEIYTVSPNRDDYRITIEGMDVKIAAKNVHEVIECLNVAKLANVFDVSDLDGRHLYIHAWWD